MASLRKGHCYSPIKRAYTRKSKFKKQSFIKAVPTSKVVRYHMGDLKKKFNYSVHLIAKKPHQIRHNALESSRQIINRNLTKKITGNDFHFILRVYPHHVLRENKMLTGAGADRMQTGMQQAFGKAIGIAAQLRKNQKVFSVQVNKENIGKAKESIETSRPRLPGTYYLEVEEI